MASTSGSPAHNQIASADLLKAAMNKLLNRKKSPEDILTTNSDAHGAQSSSGPTSPILKKSATSRWKKQRKQPEPKPEPEVNIGAALPSTDDFRTSLLMPNLSARFSMLRDQDPDSLIGKASDDSVLQPRRRSRMNELGFGSGPSGLNDIAEVQSINSSIRPPFAYEKHHSFASEDGYGSESDSVHNGSIMSRSRPGEGNIMFGGRQKVYKIPTSGPSSTKLGRALYEDDIGMSAFQRYRKERGTQDGNDFDQEDPEFDFGLDQPNNPEQDDGNDARTPNDSAKDLSHSPSLSSYDKKRSTSSTARSEARSSTAATSVASQPVAATPSPLAISSQAPAAATPSVPNVKRSDTKTRRLYEQGLDQHMQEQQTSAMSRLNSIQRQRSLQQGGKQSPPVLQTAKSASNLQEKNSQPVFALRAQSPPPTRGLTPLVTFGSLSKASSNNPSPAASVPHSPVSPQEFDSTPLTQALEPGDRGKATALGAFNKPAQQFDEKQYLERQQQLQRSQSRGAIRKDAFQQRIGRFEKMERERDASEGAERSRSSSAPRGVPRRGDSLRKKPESSKAYNVFHQAASQLPPIAQSADPDSESEQPKQDDAAGAQQYDTHRTFFGNISASDSEDEEDDQSVRSDNRSQVDHAYGPPPGRWQPTPLPSVSEHPATRDRDSKPSLAEEDEDAEMAPQPLRPTPSSQSLRNDAQAENPRPDSQAENIRVESPAEGMRADTQAQNPIEVAALDSPTLGPSATEGLSGMVHHLRQKSNQSSLYPNDNGDDIPELPGMPPSARNTYLGTHINTDSRTESGIESFNASNPWDLDEIDNAYNLAEADHSPTSPVEVNAFSQNLNPHASTYSNIINVRESAGSQYPASVNAPTWQTELSKHHTRDASTATQQERDAFANELAARRAAIQESMRSYAEQDTSSRNVSPAPSAGGAKKAFGMLRAKPSRESVAPSKAMKMLGLGASASTTNVNSQYERSEQSMDMSRPRNDSVSRAPPVPSGQPRTMVSSEWPQGRPRGDSETSNPFKQLAGRVSQARSRSNSEATTGRSRSGTANHRDDPERTLSEGINEGAEAVFPESTPKTSSDAAQSSFEEGHRARARSNSRPPAMSSYFDSKHLQNPGNPANRLATGNATPLYSPAGSSARPSPSVSPIAQNPTPPHSGTNTPQGASFKEHPVPIVQPRSGALRKKTISKFDISEPTLISSTSNVDTIELPEGASLRNGMDEPPPVPPINPKRRGTRKLFGLGRSEMSEDATSYSNFGRSKTPDPWMSRPTPEPDFSSAPQVRKASTPGLAASEFESNSTPALQQYGFPSSGGPVSPERVERAPLPQNAPMEGGMF
ncbi:hypothetical protein KC319_g4611 [Hortaea werneckii]|nr:hypothetical protein KC352_g11074 [Hortaea werneckii]KAI7567302.1 hypothetical protein KC317_g5077 [Hortaea werneckii]KAI7619151.1 hypothetical protein KC346_g4709 [Hortaea werneckii]KAI7675259.1 hypothetical protein KC319_g4611 [Hortaea werneckii]KAI7707461.1 hypothetical protein KC322_g5475 [Hortaea werneckii]